MRLFVIISLLVALSSGKPINHQPQHVAVSQDTAGNYKITYNIDGQSRVEQGNADGTVSGSYSYVDANGVRWNVQYTAGPDGFRATGTHIPVPPVDHNVPVGNTEDVARARELHFAIFKQKLPQVV